MAVDICRGADVAVTEPFLNLFHGHVVCQQQRSAAMPEIVETDMPQAFHFQQLAEIGGNASRIEDIAHGMQIGIVGTENQDRKRTGRQRLTPLPACSKKSIT